MAIPDIPGSTRVVSWTIDRFDEFGNDLIEKAKLALRKTAMAVKIKAQETITEKDIIDTGALRQSIYAQVGDFNEREACLAAAIEQGKTIGQHSGESHEVNEAMEGEHVVQFEAKVASCVDYGVFIEEGTVNQPARPFLGPAAEGAKELFYEFMKNEGGSI